MRRFVPVAFVLVAAALILALGMPALVSALAPGFIRGLGPFAGQPVSVSVDASLGGLLKGRLDRVTVSGTLATGDATLDGLRLTLSDAGVDRTFVAVSGTADAITSPVLADGALTLRGVVIDGSSAAGIRVDGTVDAATIEGRIVSELESLGLPGTTARLEDGSVAIGFLGLTIHARFEVVGGDVRLQPDGPLPAVTVLAAGGSTPGRAVGIDVTSAGLTIHWLIDAAHLAALTGG